MHPFVRVLIFSCCGVWPYSWYRFTPYVLLHCSVLLCSSTGLQPYVLPHCCTAALLLFCFVVHTALLFFPPVYRLATGILREYHYVHSYT